MSELRRTARALVEQRVERFESRHSLAESQTRLAGALDRARPFGSTVFTPSWDTEGGRVVLAAAFAPPPRVLRVLQGLSIGIALALAASAWAIATQDGATRFLLPLTTAFAILALPFVALGLGSQRAADETRIVRAIRAALLDEEERLPPPQRWNDED